MRPRRSAALSDTSPAAGEVLLHLLRKAPPWRKLEAVSDLNRTLRELAISLSNFSESDEELAFLL